MKTTEQENTGRNPDGTFAPGFSGNPGGRPRNSLKDYMKYKLSEMTPEEKEEWLKDIPKELQWQMGEGRPAQGVEHSGKDGKDLVINIVSYKDDADNTTQL